MIMLSTWDVVEHTTGWRPKALRNALTQEKIDGLQELRYEITESQRRQLIDRGYGKAVPVDDEDLENADGYVIPTDTVELTADERRALQNYRYKTWLDPVGWVYW